MDEPAAVDAKIIGAPTASKYTTQMQENTQGQLQRKALSVTSNNRGPINYFGSIMPIKTEKTK